MVRSHQALRAPRANQSGMPEDKAADPAEVVDVKLAPLYDFHKKVLLFFETTPLFELRTLETIENNLAK